jgi:hypothetical protein
MPCLQSGMIAIPDSQRIFETRHIKNNNEQELKGVVGGGIFAVEKAS